MQTCNIMGVNIAVTDMDKTLRLVECSFSLTITGR